MVRYRTFQPRRVRVELLVLREGNLSVLVRIHLVELLRRNPEKSAGFRLIAVNESVLVRIDRMEILRP